MSTVAAVMTGRGMGAISTIQLYGDSAEKILTTIFKPVRPGRFRFESGRVLLGCIVDSGRPIDQVTVGCEGPQNFAINCHGNPIIVQTLMQLLARNGAELVCAERLLAAVLSTQKEFNTIQIEAEITQRNAKTLEGAKILAHQAAKGLSAWAAGWLNDINTTSLAQITNQARTILEHSRAAELIIFGCKAVIAGPPNTGKSTLLNCLSGRQKAIVTDIAGTTRDWVSAQCRIGPLSVELIDTAGLDEKLTVTSEDTVEKASQRKSIEILDKADFILLVLDNSQTCGQLDERILEKVAGKRIITVLNKCDLPAGFDAGKLPQILANTVRISAKFGTGIENLLKKIQQLCGVIDFDLKTTVCFTGRQKNLLSQLCKPADIARARSIITQLLKGPVNYGISSI